MKPFITFAIIAISLLLTTGCATPSSAPVQSPTTLEATETSDSEQDQDSSEIDESQSQSQEDDPEGWTPLMEAAAQDDLATVKRLIASKADLNAQTSQGWTALTVATIEMYTDIVEALISAGVDVNAQNGDLNVSALMIAANGGRIRRGLGFPSPSMEANTVVKMLLSAHADVNAANGDGATVLQYAVMTGDPEIIKTLLSAGADVNAVTNNQMTALMMAAACQSVFCTDLGTKEQLVQTLLQAKAAVNAQDAYGNTALHYIYAIYANANNPYSEHAAYIARLLLDAGADPTLKNNEGISVEAFVAGLKVKTLPQPHPIDPQSAAMMRALLYRDFEKASELLTAGVDVNARDNHGETLLMKAIISSFWMGDLNNDGLEVAKSLIAAGADVNAADANGTTALMLASERLIPNMAEALLNAGADAKVKDHEGRTALDRFEQGKTRFFRFHYDRRDVFYKDGTIALTFINHEKLHDLLQAAMK